MTEEIKNHERVYRFGSQEFTFPADLPETEVRRLVGKVFPAAKTAKFIKDDDGSFTIQTIEGVKGVGA